MKDSSTVIDPLSLSFPKGAERWEDLYPPYLLFSKENQEWEKNQFWFQDNMHHPRALMPFETIIPECIRVSLGQNSSRVFTIPNAYGIEQRIINGYVFFSPVDIKNADLIKERSRSFEKRTNYYYKNWEKAYENWKDKVETLISHIKEIKIPENLPEVEDEEVVYSFAGKSQGGDLLEAYNNLINSIFLAWQYHFEMLNVGYVAYLRFIQFCHLFFPTIEDKTISLMIKGIDSLLFKPDKKLKELAQEAYKYGIADIFLRVNTPDILKKLEKTKNGKKWLIKFQNAQDPWFYFSNGNGFYANDGSWIDDLTVPLRFIKNYIEALVKGENILGDSSEKVLLERENLVNQYRELLLTEEDQEEFNKLLENARMVAVYLEDHNFYIENWLHTIFWQKIKQIGVLLSNRNFIQCSTDLYFLSRWEVGQVLYECIATWASGGIPRGFVFWKSLIEKRKNIFGILKQNPSHTICGTIPDQICEPITLTLFGVTKDLITRWQLQNSKKKLLQIKGIGAVKGEINGEAIVIKNLSDLEHFREGGIIICESLAPSWISYFKKAKAVIADIGGIMSHTAIICREYNIPCIVAASHATKLIKTGDNLFVNGEQGIVQIRNS